MPSSSGGVRTVTFSDKTLSLMVLIALGLGGLALVFTALGQGRRRVEPRAPIQLDDALRGILEGHARGIKRLEAAIRSLHATDKEQQQLIEGAVRGGGYNPSLEGGEGIRQAIEPPREAVEAS